MSNLPPDAWRIDLHLCESPEHCSVALDDRPDDEPPDATDDAADSADDRDASGVPARLNRLTPCGICGQSVRLRSLVGVLNRRTGERLFVCSAACLKEARSK